MTLLAPILEPDLQAALGAGWLARAVERTGSTQSDLRMWCAREPMSAGQWRVLVADWQSAGRGRGGASWAAEPGTAVLMSLAGNLWLGQWLWPRLSLVAGVAVLEVLSGLPALQGATFKLKWPNDVLVQTPQGWRKVAGLLAERVGGPSSEPIWMCGLGVDIAPPLAPGLEGTALPLSSVAAGELPSRVQLAAALARAIRVEVERFSEMGGLLEAARIEAHLAFVGDEVELDEGACGARRWLRLDGIDSTGLLRGQTVRADGRPGDLALVQPLAITAARAAGWRAPGG